MGRVKIVPLFLSNLKRFVSGKEFIGFPVRLLVLNCPIFNLILESSFPTFIQKGVGDWRAHEGSSFKGTTIIRQGLFVSCHRDIVPYALAEDGSG